MAVIDLALQIGPKDAPAYVGLCVADRHLIPVDKACANARALGVALEKEVVVWTINRGAPVAPELVRLHVEKTLEELDPA